ncbi:MAG: TetR/AcrR family transcriptional regulator [Omnitrophica WOR_2 bacterium]
MNQETSPIEAKIIQAAIDCIEEYGIQGVTTRGIAARAGVNSAAINYYFRSKEALIRRCMQVTLENAFDWEEFARLPADSAKERCSAIFEDLIAGACRFPGITRAHYYAIIEGSQDSQAIEKLNEFLVNLINDLKEKGAHLEEAELRLAVAQITSAAMMTALIPGTYEKSLGIDMCDEDTRRQYVKRLVERLL